MQKKCSVIVRIDLDTYLKIKNLSDYFDKNISSTCRMILTSYLNSIDFNSFNKVNKNEN